MLMALSWFILHARYKLIHFLAVGICVVGVATMVIADSFTAREDNKGKESFITGGKSREVAPMVG